MPTNQNPTKQTDTILIVDDETASLRLTTDILSREGYRVCGPDGAESVGKDVC